MWRDHFCNLYNSVADDGSKDIFSARIKSSRLSSDRTNITVQETVDAIFKQKKGKSAGPDGIAMEALMLGNSRLFIHLNLLFNLFLSHNHIPQLFMQSLIVPLVKAKSGDLADINNYRAIALSNSVTKILESIFMNKVKAEHDCDSYQFGFKANHSTGYDRSQHSAWVQISKMC